MSKKTDQLISELKTDELIKKFNDKYPVGSTIKWRSIGKGDFPHQEAIVREPAYELHGRAMCFIKEKSGCVSIDPEFVDYSFEQGSVAA